MNDEKPDEFVMTEREVRELFGWSLADFRSARFFGFPRADYRAVGALGRLAPCWSRALVLCWRDKLRALIVR